MGTNGNLSGPQLEHISGSGPENLKIQQGLFCMIFHNLEKTLKTNKLRCASDKIS